MIRSQLTSVLLLVVVLLTACDQSGEAASTADHPAPAPSDTMSSAMRAALETFRATVQGPPPTSITGGADSRDALVRAFVSALERADTAALIRMTMNRAEYAYLYYPHSIYTHRPYEMDADTQWLLMKSDAEKGLTRILERFGGRPFNFVDYSCDTESVQEGPNRYWPRCAITRLVAGSPQTMRWFGSIWERDGHFKFVSYVNDL